MATLLDNHGRQINYLRMAVTDRCNLRCFYCMPETGIQYLPKKDLLSFGEMVRLTSILASMGITKVRLTGGEPFVRTDLINLMQEIVEVPGIRDLHITTNGVLTGRHIPDLKRLNIASVNLSLDTLDKNRFLKITRRDEFDNVMRTLYGLLEVGIPVKINAVVMDGKNTEDILSLVEFTRKHQVDVRFIEEMPFNGEGSHYPILNWTYQRIFNHIRESYPDIEKMPDPNFSTSSNYHIPGHQGTVGIIAAFSRTFCGTCNRLRVTAQGTIKTCLYDDGVLNVRDLLRAYQDDQIVIDRLTQILHTRAKDGFEAEQRRKSLSPVSESMSTIGG